MRVQALCIHDDRIVIVVIMMIVVVVVVIIMLVIVMIVIIVIIVITYTCACRPLPRVPRRPGPLPPDPGLPSLMLGFLLSFSTTYISEFD